jgi:hypothetical protein
MTRLSDISPPENKDELIDYNLGNRNQRSKQQSSSSSSSSHQDDLDFDHLFDNDYDDHAATKHDIRKLRVDR